MSCTCWDSRCEPIARVTDNTVGIAMGIPPIKRTRRLLIPSLYERFWTGNMTMISRIIPTAMEQMQKFPIAVRTCRKTIHQIFIILQKLPYDFWNMSTLSDYIKGGIGENSLANFDFKQIWITTTVSLVLGSIFSILTVLDVTFQKHILWKCFSISTSLQYKCWHYKKKLIHDKNTNKLLLQEHYTTYYQTKSNC